MYGLDTGPRILKNTVGNVFRSPSGIRTPPGVGLCLERNSTSHSSLAIMTLKGILHQGPRERFFCVSQMLEGDSDDLGVKQNEGGGR